MNCSRAGTLRVMGKALHMTTYSFVYQPTWVTYILTSSSGYVFVMPSIKGWQCLYEYVGMGCQIMVRKVVV